MFKLENYLKISILVLILSTVVFTPFIVSTSLLFPFVTGKAFFWRIVVTVLVGLWILLVFLNRKYLPKLNMLFWVFSGFVIWMAIANYFGYYPSLAFWSTFERMEGYINLLYTFAFFVVTASVINTEKLWSWVFQITLGVSLVVAFFVFFDWLGNGGRPQTLLGNPIYIAGYLLSHVFLAIFFFLKNFNERKYWCFTYGLSAVFLVFVIFLTETRGAMLGLIVGLFLISVLIFFKRNENKILRRLAFGGFVLAVLVGSFFGSVVYVANNPSLSSEGFSATYFETVKDFPVVSRFSRVNLAEGDASARFSLWLIAVDGIQEKPFFGWGQEGYSYVFNKNYKPDMYEREVWFDRSHNIFLDWALFGGLPALALYLSLFVTALALIWRSKILHYFKVAFSGLFVAYLIHNLFVFDNTVSYILFALFLAFASYSKSHSNKNEEKIDRLVSVKSFQYFVVPIVVFFVISTVYFANIKPIQANLSLVSGHLGIQCANEILRRSNSENREALLTDLKKSKCRRYMPDDYVSGRVSVSVYSKTEFAEVLFSKIADYFQQSALISELDRRMAVERFVLNSSSIIGSERLNPEIRENFLFVMEETAFDYLDQNPGDVKLKFFLSNVYVDIGQYEEALKIINEVLDEAPNRQHFLIQAGKILVELEWFEEAVEFFEKAHKLHPSFIEPKLMYGASLLYLDDKDEAFNLLNSIPEQNLIFNNFLISTFVYLKGYENLAEIYSRRLEIILNEVEGFGTIDEQTMFRVGNEYMKTMEYNFLLGNTEIVHELATEMKERFPSLKDDAERILNFYNN